MAKFSDGWYARKAEYDKNNNKFSEYMYVVYAGIIAAILGAIGLAVFSGSKKRKTSIGFIIAGVVLIIVGGALAGTLGTKDEPTPTKAEFKGCV